MNPTSRRFRRNLCAALATLALGLVAPAAGSAAGTSLAYRVGGIHDVSSACSGQNAEVEQAVDAHHHDVYEAWIGCGGIGFARSTDSGAHFQPPLSMPGSTSSTWDPALTVAPDGTLYVGFMISSKGYTYPVVDASFDHGRTFAYVTPLLPPVKHNWGDRDFLGVAPDGTLYVTWDYGPSAAAVKYICNPRGSCAFASGDLNAVIQRSTDRGRTFGRIEPISPGFPASGGDSAPLVIEPDGRLDVQYQGYTVTNPVTYSLSRGHTYFTSSTDGGRHWSAPVRVGPEDRTMTRSEWWIDGDITRDAGGTLYITWDSQSPGHDIGWLSYSTDHGVHWSPLIRATPDGDKGPHIIEAAGGAAGIVYVGWLSHAAGTPGYAQYLRTFSTRGGWLSAPMLISAQLGNPLIWPGDTFGISAFGPSLRPDGSGDVVLSWGSALAPGPKARSQIYAALVSVRAH